MVSMTLRLKEETQFKLDLISMVLNEPKSKIIEQLLNENFDLILESKDFKSKLNNWVDNFNATIKPIINALGLNETKGN